MKRLLPLLLVVTLCLGALSISVLAAIPFKDVPAGQWYYNDVSNACEMGLINGKTTDAFKPDDNLTFRCVIFDALGNSVTSREFHACLN